MVRVDPNGSGALRLPGFRSFWVASTVSEFGTYITTLSLQVLVVVTLAGSAADVGWLNAARWLPYLLFGLVVGALVDRRRRKRIVVTADFARAVLLVAIPTLWALGALSFLSLLVIVFAVGLMSLIGDSASQSFLPRLVPTHALVDAHARLDQSSAVAQTSGPLLAGALVSAVGAPIAVLVDAVTYLISGLAVWRIRVVEPVADRSTASPSLRHEIAEGLRWIYRHETLAPLAISTHGWFLFNSMLATIYVPFVLVGLALSPFQLGVTFAVAGAAGLAGAFVAVPLGRRWGAGHVVVTARALMPIAWTVIVVASLASAPWIAVVVLCAGQAIIGLAMGAENANEMGYWQALTPDAMQSRMNTTRRSVNRAMIVVGAPVGGILADAIGYVPAMVIAIGGFILVAAYLAFSPFRTARHESASEPRDPPQ